MGDRGLSYHITPIGLRVLIADFSGTQGQKTLTFTTYLYLYIDYGLLRYSKINQRYRKLVNYNSIKNCESAETCIIMTSEYNFL